MARIRVLWDAVRSSLWFVPALITAGAIGLAVATVRLDEILEIERPGEAFWLLGAGAAGASDVLSAIAGSIITVTGVVFSVTIVALQLASGQFSPRVLRNFTADRANQTVLGVFIGTFVYTLLVQRAIRFPGEEESAFVPAISVTIALAFALVSIGFLIFFIHHAARSVQVSVITDHSVKDTLKSLTRPFPSAGEPFQGDTSDPAAPDTEPAYIKAARGGYLQGVDDHALYKAACNADIVVRMEAGIGDFVLPDARIATFWPGPNGDDGVHRRIRRAFALGPERTPAQDLEFGIIELVDIALKGLSPSINDPTTAMNCIDRLGEILAELGRQPEVSPIRADDRGRLRLIARSPSFERHVGLAFDQILRDAANRPAVVARLLDTIGRVAELLPEERKPPLASLTRRVVEAAQRESLSPTQLQRLEHAAAQAFAAAAPDGGREDRHPPSETFQRRAV